MKKLIKGYENYSVSTEGVVVNEKSNKILGLYISNTGYERVTLSKNNKTKKFSIHRLIADAFIPNTENKPQVNHINEIKTDNRVENLEWVTQSENALHSIKKRKEYNKNDTTTKGYKKIVNSKTGEVVIGIDVLAEKLNLQYNTVKSRLRRNHDWFYWGYIKQ